MDKKNTFETNNTKIISHILNLSRFYIESVTMGNVSKAKHVSDFLTEAYADWIREGNPRTLGEFANHLGISQSSLGHYMNQRQLPGDQAIDKIAAKLGSRIYDIMGKARPDPLLLFITRHWDRLPDELRRDIRAQVAKYALNGANDASQKDELE